jgi:hypothetical protein
MRIIILCAALFLCACTNPSSATRVLTENGYTNIQITGYNFFACSQDDFYHTGFIATSYIGQRITGTVCEGMFFKNSTIRFS